MVMTENNGIFATGLPKGRPITKDHINQDMGTLRQFDRAQLQTLEQAVEIAEEVTSNYYKISFNEWKRHRYDIKTVIHLNESEITHHAFAQITRYTRSLGQRLRGSQDFDYYKICLQDHMILAALARELELNLLPLMAYIVTHELIHVVRFCKFLQNFQASLAEQKKEEKLVHGITLKMLSNVNLPGLSYVLKSYHASSQIEKFSER
jgi:hypothetical protein